MVHSGDYEVSNEARPLLNELLTRYPTLVDCGEDIEKVRNVLQETFETGHKLLLCGNGGSAADCEHIAGELLKGFERKRPLGAELRDKLARQAPDGALLSERLQGGLPVLSLVGHLSFSTAFANDVEPNLVFAQLVAAVGKPGDALLAISTSGNARNVLLAVQTARACELAVVGLIGRDGGQLAKSCDTCVVVPGERTPDIRELHVPVYHYLCRSLEEHFFSE